MITLMVKPSSNNALIECLKLEIASLTLTSLGLSIVSKFDES